MDHADDTPGIKSSSRLVETGTKPTIIGLYGIPGSGKTYLLNQLKEKLSHDSFSFFEGSEVIAELVPGGLESFKEASEDEKSSWRELAINKIRSMCTDRGSIGIVTGHFMFWPKHETSRQEHVCTPADLQTYTHILYLNTPERTIEKRREKDQTRGREAISSSILRRWQEKEKDGLRHACHEHGIIFYVMPPLLPPIEEVVALVRRIVQVSEAEQRAKIELTIDHIVNDHGRLETMLVLDGDKTLATVDTGDLFWQKTDMNDWLRANGKPYTLRTLFSGPLGYTTHGFLQAALLYEELDKRGGFDMLCEYVAFKVLIHHEFVSMAKSLSSYEHVGAVVLTCGLQLVWTKVLEQAGLAHVVKVIGNGRIGDGTIVTPSLKAAVVDRLRTFHHIYTWAFGDSPLDLPMLRAADEAIVVVGPEENRSSTMEAALEGEIIWNRLEARQALLPASTKPRLDTTRLPIIDITDEAFLKTILEQHRSKQAKPIAGTLYVTHATDRAAAKLLMSPMRDASNSGPSLREAHRRAGWYLAMEFLTSAAGIEDHSIPHVQGFQTRGFRLLAESRTTIVALMRGGEPMALGVNDAFPLAMFLHAHEPQDMKAHHFHQDGTVVLVDSVMNSGKTVVQFVRYARKLAPRARVFVLVGVVQSEAIAPHSPVRKALVHDGDISLIALRVSENKFTGRGSTDTGNRLFNTTHVD